MKKLMLIVVCMLLASNVFAVRLPLFAGGPAKKIANDLTKMGLQVRIDQGSPAGSIKEIGCVEEFLDAGKNVNPGSVVVLKVYAATRPVGMMNFVGFKADEAVKFFEDRGIPYTKNAVIANCPPDTVSAHTPGPGQMYTPGTSVVLSICAAGVQVPNLIGKKLRELDRCEINPNYINKTGQLGYNSKVVRQDPQPGAMIARGNKVTVELASDGVVVDNYIGFSASSVQRSIESIPDIKLEVVGARTGKVFKQSIPAGTKVPFGTVVKVEMQ